MDQGVDDASLILFFNRRLEESDFELTKPSTGQDYMSTNKHNTKTGDTS
jgi:hypothetical protein